MLNNWLEIGKRRRKLIEKIIALDSSRTIKQLSKWLVHNLERELFFLENYPTIYRQNHSISISIDDRIDELIKKAKDNGMWNENPVKGKWV